MYVSLIQSSKEDETYSKPASLPTTFSYKPQKFQSFYFSGQPLVKASTGVTQKPSGRPAKLSARFKREYGEAPSFWYSLKFAIYLKNRGLHRLIELIEYLEQL